MLAILLLVVVKQSAVQLGAGLFLYGLVPGLCLTVLLFPEQNSLERLVLSVGSSFALSTLVLLLVAVVWAPLTAAKVLISLAGLLVLLFVVAWFRRRHIRIATVPPRRVWLSRSGVLLVAGALRLPWLGAAEFQDDEIDVGNAVHQIIRGNVDTLFSDRRGPAQILITTAFYLVTGKPTEWILRAPVALANLAAIAALLFVLAWAMFNWRTALVSGLLVSLDGFVLAYGCVVQMQSTLLLMMVLATLCFYLAYKTVKQAPREYGMWRWAHSFLPLACWRIMRWRSWRLSYFISMSRGMGVISGGLIGRTWRSLGGSLRWWLEDFMRLLC